MSDNDELISTDSENDNENILVELPEQQSVHSAPQLVLDDNQRSNSGLGDVPSQLNRARRASDNDNENILVELPERRNVYAMPQHDVNRSHRSNGVYGDVPMSRYNRARYGFRRYAFMHDYPTTSAAAMPDHGDQQQEPQGSRSSASRRQFAAASTGKPPEEHLRANRRCAHAMRGEAERDLAGSAGTSGNTSFSPMAPDVVEFDSSLRRSPVPDDYFTNSDSESSPEPMRRAPSLEDVFVLPSNATLPTANVDGTEYISVVVQHLNSSGVIATRKFCTRVQSDRAVHVRVDFNFN